MFLHRKRRDANHGPLAKLAERIGATHLDLSQLGDDAPDALIGFRGVNYLIEFKSGRKRLKPGQERFQRTWRGQVHTIRTGDEFLALLLGKQYATKKAADVAVAAVAARTGPGTGLDAHPGPVVDPDGGTAGSPSGSLPDGPAAAGGRLRRRSGSVRPPDAGPETSGRRPDDVHPVRFIRGGF